MKKIWFKFATFYGGGGLGSWGTVKAGGIELFNIDNGSIQEKVYKKNFKAPYLKMDALKANVKTVNQELKKKGVKLVIKPGSIDLIILSAPCTGISRRNRLRHPFSKVNFLLLDCPRAIREFKPKIAIIENVESILDKEMKPLLDLFLAKCGALTEYNFQWRVLNAKDYSVPQSRLRFIVILVRKDVGKPVWPKPTTKDYKSLELRNVLPGIVAFDAGGSRKAVKDKNGNKVAKMDKWTPADRPVGTLTATGGEKFLDIRNKKRKPSIRERQILCTAQDMNFEGLKYNEAVEVLGNGIMPNFIKAVVENLAKQLLQKSSKTKVKPVRK
jgi:site-specific DNA-cytosine methylase